MLAAPVLWVLISALLHAAWNAGVKRTGDPEAAALGVVAGAAAISGAAAAVEGAWLPLAAAPWTVASGIVEAVYFVALSRALARLPLGTAYGLSRGGGQLVTWPVSIAAFAEPVTAWTAGGALLLAAGLFGRVRPPFDGRGVAWAAACALAIGAYPLTYKQALRGGAPHELLFFLSLAVALPVQAVALADPRRVWGLRRQAPTLLLSAAACAASFLLFLHALDLDHAGRVSALRNTSIAFATVFGALAGERVDRRAWAAAIAITVGAIAISG